MARLPRLIVDGLPHLVSQRVQHQQTLARDATDRAALLERLRLAAAEHAVDIHAYALIDERFDLVATPRQAQGLSRFMQAVARRHSADFNRRHGRAGGLWAGRYRVCVLDLDSWLLTCMWFVEQQAHRLGAVAGRPEDAIPATSSSEAHHVGAKAEAWLVDPAPYWALGNTPFERHARYREQVSRTLPEAVATQIERSLKGGWALGSDAFSSELALNATRPALPRLPGRPKRTRTKSHSVPDN